MTDLQDRTELDPFQRVINALDANFPPAPRRRAAHATGVVLTGTFTATPEASTISRALHFAGGSVPVVARLSNFPGGSAHPDPAPENNPRGLAVQFRLPDGSTTDLLAHTIDGFPGRVVEDFSDFLEVIAPGGPGPEGYLATHAAAAAFVHAVQTHGVPASFATLRYFGVNAFRFHAADGTVRAGRYTCVPEAGLAFLREPEVRAAGPRYLSEELAERLAAGPVRFTLTVTLAEPGDRTDDANVHWPDDRRQVALGLLALTDLAQDSELTQQGLFFDPVRLVDGITTSDDPLLAGRSRAYPISLDRRHSG